MKILNHSPHFWLATATIFFLVSCQSKLRFKANPSLARMTRVFGSQQGIHPLLVSSCQRCHDSSGQAERFPFAQANAEESFKQLLDKPDVVKIMVSKVEGGHPIRDQQVSEGAIAANFGSFVDRLREFQDSLCSASSDYCPLAETITTPQVVSGAINLSFALGELGFAGAQAQLELNVREGFYEVSNFVINTPDSLIIEGVIAELSQGDKIDNLTLVAPDLVERVDPNSNTDILIGVTLLTELGSNASVSVRLKFQSIRADIVQTGG